ncbi:hypothetical protein [Apilactobacillus zhangqiuensis]|uniref:hypothetical protein n=1 Tax=Apilactobacillus zhangqiuensis TaxID=2841031 RepID=UPI001C7E0385|nr:hypothetical protein [Apilactobacillus zhangqiuensis]
MNKIAITIIITAAVVITHKYNAFAINDNNQAIADATKNPYKFFSDSIVFNAENTS